MDLRASFTVPLSASLTLPAGGEAVNEPIPFPTTGGGSGNLVVSLHLPTAVTLTPVHAKADTVYPANGNSTTDAAGAPDPGCDDQRTRVDRLPGTQGSNPPGSVVNISRSGLPAQDDRPLADGSGTTAADVAETVENEDSLARSTEARLIGQEPQPSMNRALRTTLVEAAAPVSPTSTPHAF
ncbi:hypothetical protein [Amycolatopsis sacchari]|uniref:Uncharacterized protein n=1 Tax=Amycolatopsis sacchari TaxID=115433 RepID=A0A1I3UNA6_9PSEU|nr:hypothetical protein [Amycolatopsis sacchari]SFJ84405.1 hypothetical protein SAMN05421835_109151 [Amycolatopsis sacchari]